MNKRSLKILMPIALMIAAGTWIYISVCKYGFYTDVPGNGFYPALIGIVLIILCLLDLSGTFKAEREDVRLIQFLPVAGLFGVIGVSYVLGTFAGIAIFLFLWFKVLERYSIRFSIAITVITAGTLWLVFDEFIHIHFQTGLIGSLLL